MAGGPSSLALHHDHVRHNVFRLPLAIGRRAGGAAVHAQAVSLVWLSPRLDATPPPPRQHGVLESSPGFSATLLRL